MNTEKPFYVYVHRYASGPKCGQVFYVGKGKARRAWSASSRSIYWNRIVAKYGFSVNIVMHFENEICSFSFERFLISFYGRENLCNATNGGEGVSGMRHTDESKLKMSGPRPNAKAWLSGKKAPDWLKEKWRLAKLGSKQSESHAEKSRTAKLGKKVSDTSKLNLDKRKPVVNCSGVVFESVNDAARVLSKQLGKNVSQGTISMALCGRRKTAYGYKWRFLA